MEELKKKYGFWTATAMVVGIVIGSGVFFKADDVLKAAGGSLPTAIFAWLIGGMIMIVTAYTFSTIACRIQKNNGLVDYFEAAYGHNGGYLIAWFMTFIYYPSLVAVLAWVSANYTVSLFAIPQHLWTVSAIYMVLFFIINIVSPLLAGRWQVLSTIIKLFPLALVAIAGTINGLITGQTLESFTNVATSVGSGGGLAVATLSTAFAYEGWIIATSINAELKDAKKTLPKALIVGTLTVMLIYILYYLGISGVLSNNEIIAAGDNAPVEVFTMIFGNIGGTLLSVFVIISCLGTLNGLTMGCIRGMHSIASRNMGPRVETFTKVHSKTNSAIHSGILGFLLTSLWMMVWYGNFKGWWGGFMDISELPIATIYLIYISIYIWVMRTFDHLNPVKRFVIPGLAGIGSLYIIWGAIQKDMFFTFEAITLLLLLGGWFLRGNKHLQEKA